MDATVNTMHHAADDTDIKTSYTLTRGGETVTVACVHRFFPPKLSGTPNIPNWRDWYCHFDDEGLVGDRIGRGAHDQCFAEAANTNFARSKKSSFLEYWFLRSFYIGLDTRRVNS